ncbi:hypothetical protein J8I26_16970 [Herbaspirillum sp. LeCh32-8]|uniref:hypothetical protein n=1 Tax=Herbaspirillum sp. LeCh32-8 TaxID=2821356 RepID=UPI001AE217FD|nr:hypothetical protein [Herbaspirillum sp. LeCh32-8]MBP0599805.1 hypothetical protein [Herbaspirillum sp. LeCh32-8]
MARNPVTPVIPVDPVGAVRRVDSGSTYFRHLELWRIHSEVYGAERRRKLERGVEAGFEEILRDSGARED